MPTIRTLIPTLDPSDSYTKVQCDVSLRDKRTILSAVADDGIYTFIMAHTFSRLATFIRLHDIKSYDSSSRERLLEFIRNGTDTCVDRAAVNSNEPRATSGLQYTSASTSSQPSSLSPSRPKRKQGKETKE